MRHGFSWMDMSTVRILYHMYYCMRSHFFTLKVGYVIPFWSGKLWSKFFSIQLIQLLIKSLKIPSSMLYYSNPLVCSSSWRTTLLLVSARQCNMPYIKWEWRCSMSSFMIWLIPKTCGTLLTGFEFSDFYFQSYLRQCTTTSLEHCKNCRTTTKAVRI